MNKRVKRITLWQRLVWMLIAMMGILPLAAQEDYNPENPPEPNTLYRVTVLVTPDDAGYVSGAGKYQKGEEVYFHTSSHEGFRFLHWLRNGKLYTTETWFSYTVEAENVEFKAVYEFNPSSPSEPSEALKYPLWLTCSPSGACSFNRSSGEKTVAGEYIYIDAYASQGFIFEGWYDANGNKVGEDSYLPYTMPNAETTLTARFTYNPDSPGDPAGGAQDDVDNDASTGGDSQVMLGDANGDGVVNSTDITLTINKYLGKNSNIIMEAADMNGDGMINSTDITLMIQKYLTGN